MKKLFKRIAAVCMAAIMMATVLCTYAFAVGVIVIDPSGNVGNYTVKYKYSVDDEGARTEFVTSGETIYSISFSPVSGTSSYIKFYNTTTKKDDEIIHVPQVTSGGMPGTLNMVLDLKPNTKYRITFSSKSDSVIANGTFTIPHIKSYS